MLKWFPFICIYINTLPYVDILVSECLFIEINNFEDLIMKLSLMLFISTISILFVSTLSLMSMGYCAGKVFQIGKTATV